MVFSCQQNLMSDFSKSTAKKYFFRSMSKKTMIRIAYAVIIALIILILYLIVKSGNGDWVWAVIMTLVMGEAYLLLPKKWFARFKRKETNPLTDSKE